MTVRSTRSYAPPLHPLHAVLLAFSFPLFLGALASDLTYFQTYQVQWANFSSWLIAGALLGSAFALVWALADMIRYRATRALKLSVYFVLLLVMWILGFVNALVHAKDAWATMPAGLYLSIVTAALALVATLTGHARTRARR
ncbi:DUF2231 domain-containing protein [Neorhizobium alkalisoli]|uniref:DUF2231 domain-containing protein n=1 Tax=Neorhizobium alkalisoli TaxID=528178 RepID=UPI000CF890B1|nr:DUF2231 domain-containing protein [Neorhizobium alkalisoli]